MYVLVPARRVIFTTWVKVKLASLRFFFFFFFLSSSLVGKTTRGYPSHGEIPEGNEEKSGHVRTVDRFDNNSCLTTYGRLYFARTPSVFGQSLSQRTVRKYCTVFLRGCDISRVNLVSGHEWTFLLLAYKSFYRATVPKQRREETFDKRP